MGSKVRSKGGDKRRILSMYQGSDGSDYDYEIGEDEEFDDSDVYCSSLDGEESEDNTGELEDMTEEEEKLRVTGRLNRRNDFPRENKSAVGKTSKLRRVSYKEDSDKDYEEEDDDEDDDDDYDIDDKNQQKRFPSRKRNGVRNAPKKKAASGAQEKDDCYGSEDDGCDYGAQKGVRKAPKKKKASSTEENDDDYKTKDDEYDEDDEDYDDEEEVEEDEDDEDFSPDEIDVDDEDEFPIVKKTKKVRRLSLQEKQFCRGRKRNSSKVSSESKRKKSTMRCGFQRKISSSHRIAGTKGKSTMKKTTKRNFGFKRRKLVLDSDSDFVDSASLDQEYTKSEEEMEQFRDASELNHYLNAGSRKSSLKKRSPEEANLCQERKHNTRKGKGKVENSKKEVAKQVCGICFSEEGKKTVRGTLNCCSHYFCFTCIMEWSKVESRCPLCKDRFVTISKPARLDAAFDLRTTVVKVPERDQVYQPSEEELRAYLDPYENVICTECHRGGDDAYMLLCDLCDSPAHTFCVGLDYAVPEGNWYCEGCRPTALGSSNPLATNSTRDRRTTNGLSGLSSPSGNVRVAIDLNRVYEPETPLAEENGISSSPRHLDRDLRAASSVTGSGVQTVRERRRRRHQIAQFVNRTGGIPTGTSGDHRIAQRIEWGSRFAFQNMMNPETTLSHATFSQGRLQDNFTSSLNNTHLLPATLSNPRNQRIWGQAFTAVNGAADGTLQG